VIFNEWSTSWGRPDHAGMVALAGKLAGTGIRYLVMDAGWFLPETGTWGSAHGDWIPSKTLYPHGLRATAEAIRAKGLIPGLWFEMETCGPDSVLYQRTEWMLRRDGTPIAAGGRRFLDFRRPEVVDYLAGKVIATLRDNHFGYLKVDYNATLGIGVDGGDSPGAALQDHLGGVGAFFERIRRELPDLVIENCSSGGHRLTPYFFARSAMSSFSDAHECPEIPLIAADLHRLMLPRQCQIWAVLRAGEPLRRTLYLITGGFLGRLCFSGDFTRLSPEQEEWVRRAVRFYERVAPLIREGRTRRLGPTVRVRNHAEGWQAVQRIPPNDTQRLVVAHTFGGAVPDVLDIALAAGPGWRIADGLWETPPEWLDDAGVLRWTNPGQWAGMAILLERA